MIPSRNIFSKVIEPTTLGFTERHFVRFGSLADHVRVGRDFH